MINLANYDNVLWIVSESLFRLGDKEMKCEGKEGGSLVGREKSDSGTWEEKNKMLVSDYEIKLFQTQSN